MWRSIVFLSLMVLPLKEILSQDTRESRLISRAYQLWSRGENDSALFLLNGIYPSGTEAPDSLVIANISYTKGIIFLYTSSLDSTLFHLEKSRKIAKNISSHRLEGMSLELLGQFYKSQGLLVRSLEMYNAAKGIYQEHGINNFMGTVLTEIGNLEASLNNFEAAKGSHKQALKYYENSKDSVNLGLGKSNLAYALSKQHKYDSAITNFREAIQLKKKYSSERSLSYTYQYLGETFLDINKTDSARKYLNSAHRLKKKVDDTNGLAETSNALASLNLKEQRMTEARTYLDSAYRWALAAQSLSPLIENLKIQRSWYNQMGRYREAIEIDNRYDILRDSLFQDEKLKVQELQSTYSLNESEQERLLEQSRANLAEQKGRQQQIVILSISLALVILIALVYFISRARKLTSEKNVLLESHNLMIEQQKNDIRHRAKNHLSMVSYILTLMRRETQDQEVIKHIQSAQHLMLTFSSLEMHLYDKPEDSIIDLSAYLKEWEEKFLENLPPLTNQYTIAIQSEGLMLPSKLVVPIALIITELATNSLKHLALKGHDTHLEISASKSQNELVLNVSDNGPGMDSESPSGMGWQIIRTLCKSIKANMQTRQENGFRFELKVPINHS